MNIQDLGAFLLIAIIAMSVCMAITPIMIKNAALLGMIDKPDPRKIHVAPIPRVGGVGLVIGAMVPMFIWLPFSHLIISILFGAIVLLVFGIWDDMKELGHYVKFIGQFVAVIVVVYYGGLYVQHFPFIGLDSLPESIGKPFTVIAMVGVINALNHSDGLDGLAGGESLLSLGAMAYLAYLYDGANALVIACAAIGGIFGFLRFNSHPARVFMGDGGSQFIGYIVGILSVMLTQNVNSVLSPALPLLLVGLPIIDILAVFFLRAKGKMNLFRATRNHVHHRLLDLGFYHYESVMLIYSIQAFFVICAISLPYANDFLITGIYLIMSGVLFTLLTLAERSGFQAHRPNINNNSEHGNGALHAFFTSKRILNLPQKILETGVMIFLIGAALMSTSVPADIAYSALILLILLILFMLLPMLNSLFTLRLVIFVSIGYAVYLLTNYPPDWLILKHYLAYLFFAILALAGFLTIRLSSDNTFQITPLDYLAVIMLLLLAFIPESPGSGEKLTWMALQMVVLFYASEMVLQHKVAAQNRLSGAVLAALCLVAVRGLL